MASIVNLQVDSSFFQIVKNNVIVTLNSLHLDLVP